MSTKRPTPSAIIYLQNAAVGDPRDEVTDYIRTKEFTPNTMLALRGMINEIGTEMAQYKEPARFRAKGAKLPQRHVRGQRSHSLNAEIRQAELHPADVAILKNYKIHIDKATSSFPLWVKVAVALALGPGHNGRVEAHRRNGRRENRKEPFHVRPGSSRGNHGDGHDWRSRRVRLTCKYDARAVFWRGGHNGGQSLRPTMGDGAQPGLLAWVLTLPAAMTLSGFLFFAFRQFVFRG